MNRKLCIICDTELIDTDKFYLENNIMRPPAVFPESLRNHMDLLTILTKNLIIPRYGLLSIVILFILLIRFIITKFNYLTDDKIISNFLIPYLFAIIFGSIIFMPFSFHVYIKHEIPLIAPLFYSSYAFIITKIITYKKWNIS